MNRNGTSVSAAEIQTIRSREQLAAFLRGMVAELRGQPGTWQNGDLPSFLSAMAAWVEDMDGYYANRGEDVPDAPTWQTLRDILSAARVYE